jgi:aerobic carbon-monoxide dehydrogenase medium subunit
MYPRKFDYVRAGSVAEALNMLQEHGEAKLLAGGHSLIPLMKLRQVDIETLVDIGRIAELKGFSANGSIKIGALTTHAMLAANSALPQALREAAANVGDLQVRNRGTLGGNVSHADPASDHPTVLSALGATFSMTGPRGSRSVPAEQFFTGLFETALGADEILTAIEVPIHSKGTGSAYAKMAHPASGYAMLGAAAVITLEGDQCSAASVWVGGLTPKATRAPSVEAALTGKMLNKSAIEAAAQAVADDLAGDDVLGDFLASPDYRKEILPIYVHRALSLAAERAGQASM